MEEISAFAAYNAIKKRKEKHSDKKVSKKAQNKNKSSVYKVVNKQTRKIKLKNPVANVPKQSKTGRENDVISKHNSEKCSETSEVLEEQIECNNGTETRIDSLKNVDTGDVEISKRYSTSDEMFSKSKHDGILSVEKRKEEGNSSTASFQDSITVGMDVFKWLLKPINIYQFFTDVWEKRPCLVSRNDPTYFSNLISFAAIDQMLLRNHVEFTKNIDITSYIEGQRQTHNPEGRALPPVVWDFYSQGCSIRLLNPQTFLSAIYTLNSSLQEYFHCMVGANVYLTPPNSQGFAPHYDDIEAFVLQVEGQKRWKLYSPRCEEEKLPRFSSQNFTQEEIGQPTLDKVLKSGDVLYFPRGTIHQAFTEGNQHSLHITLSVYQRNSYADLFEQMVPLMLSKAILRNLELRRGLPLSIWYNLGSAYLDKRSKDRQDIIHKCQTLLQEVISDLPIDEAVDQMAKRFMHDALPPEITPEEKTRHIFGNKVVLDHNGKPVSQCKITNKSKVRLLRANILRLVQEEDEIRIYYYSDNSKEYHEYDPNFLEIGHAEASAVEFLIKHYPEYVVVGDLPVEDDDDKIIIAQELWNRGLLILDKPIK